MTTLNKLGRKVEVKVNGQILEGTVINYMENEHFNTQVLTSLGTVWVHESELMEVKETEIKYHISYGEADETDFKMMENFKLKVKQAFNKHSIQDITFTLYKNIYPLEAVIHFVGEEKHYLRYNLYEKDLEIHNTGYMCTDTHLTVSKAKIIKDSTL